MEFIVSALPIFLLMLGAAFLGFLLAWLLFRNEQLHHEDPKTAEIKLLESKLNSLQIDYEKVLEYSNSFHREKKELNAQNDLISIQLTQAKSELAQLEKDKSFLIEEFNNFREADLAAPGEGGRASDNEKEMQELHLQVNELNQELFAWKNKYHALDEQFQQSNKENNHQKPKPKSKSDKQGKDKKWESKFKALKLKFLELTHQKNLLENNMESLKTANDKLLSEIIEIKANLPEPTIIPETVQKKEKEKDIFQKIKKRSALINFKKIGTSTEKKKDDLKQINGVGPFIEKKLNALGIYKFEQIAKLDNDDLTEIIKIIELPAGIINIKGRDWIEQAKNMK